MRHRRLVLQLKNISESAWLAMRFFISEGRPTVALIIDP